MAPGPDLPLQDGAVLAPDGDQPRVVRQEAEARHVAAVAAVHVTAARDLARGRAVEAHGNIQLCKHASTPCDV